MHGYSETFWNLFSETPAINFRTLPDSPEKQKQRGKSAESRSINLSALYRRQFRRTPWRAALYIYLNKKVNKPSSTFNQLEREAIPSSPSRDI